MSKHTKFEIYKRFYSLKWYGKLKVTYNQVKQCT